MQHENKQPHWKEKLSNTNLLSSEAALNKEVSWETLHSRLQNRRKRRKARLYWVAAACLLPLCFVVMLPFFRDKNNIVKSAPHQNVKTKQPAPGIVSSQKDALITTPTELTAKKEITSVHSRKKIRNANSKPESGMVIKDSAASTEIIVYTPPVDSVSNNIVTAAAQQKKKLPVVHINELNEPVITVPIIAQSHSPRHFPLQIAHGEVAGKEIKTVRNTGFINFKATSPTN